MEEFPGIKEPGTDRVSVFGAMRSRALMWVNASEARQSCRRRAIHGGMIAAAPRQNIAGVGKKTGCRFLDF